MNLPVPSEVLVSLFTNKIVEMLSHVVNITVHSVSITWCKLWQQFGWVTELKCRRLHFFCTPYILSKVQIYTLNMWDIDWKRMFWNVWIIEDMVDIPIFSCTLQSLIDNMVHISGPYFIWYASLSLVSSASSSVLPLYTSTMRHYSSSSSRMLTRVVFWMFIHRQNFCVVHSVYICFPIKGSWDAPLSCFRELVYN